MTTPELYDPKGISNFVDKNPGEVPKSVFWQTVYDRYGSGGLLDIYLSEYPDEAEFFENVKNKYGKDAAADALLGSFPEPPKPTERPTPVPQAQESIQPNLEARQQRVLDTQQQVEERSVEEMLTGSMMAQPPTPPEIRESRAVAQQEVTKVPEVEQGYATLKKVLAEKVKQQPEPVTQEADPQWEAKLRFRLKNKFYPDDVVENIVAASKINGLPLAAEGDIPEYEADFSVTNIPSGMKMFVKGLLLLPRQTAASLLTAMQGYKGASVVNKGRADRFIESAQKDMEKTVAQAIETYKNQKFLPGIKITDVAQLPQNLAFSGVSLVAGTGAGLAVGVPIAMMPVPGARGVALKAGAAAGAGAAGTVAFQMASYQIMQDYLEMKDAEMFEKEARHITAQEEQRLKSDFNGKAIKYGLWEAIPEVASGAMGFGILMAPLEKVVTKTLAGRMLVKFAAIYGEEVATETITQMGQVGIQGAAGLPGGREVNWDDPREWLTAFKEVAPQTFLLTAVISGAGATAVNTARKIASLKQEVPESSPMYARIMDKMLSGESKQAIIDEADLVASLLKEQAVEAPKRVEEAEADGVQRTMLEAEPLPETASTSPTSPTVRRARLAPGEVVLAPIKRAGKTKMMKVEIVDASDPSSIVVKLESGTQFRTGRSTIKLLEEVIMEEPVAPPAPEVPPTATIELPAEQPVPAETPAAQAATEEVPAKEMWQMTKQEYVASKLAKYPDAPKSVTGSWEQQYDAGIHNVPSYVDVPMNVLESLSEAQRKRILHDNPTVSAKWDAEGPHQSWRMTYRQFLQEYKKGGSLGTTPAKADHRDAVRRALSEGKDVPANVLAEYPELTAEAAPEPAAEAPVEAPPVPPPPVEVAPQEPKQVVPIQERPVRRLSEGKATKIDVLTRKKELLTEIDAAIAAAPDEQGQYPEGTRRTTGERGTIHEGEQIPDKEPIAPTLKFKIDGGTATVFNTKESLQKFKKRVSGMPLSTMHPEQLYKPSKLQPLAANRERVDPLAKGLPKGYFSDSRILVKGALPKNAKFDPIKKMTDPEPVMALLTQPTEPAEIAYYLTISDEDIGVSEVPIANIDPENKATPRVIYKSQGKYYAYDQYRHNVLRKRFPNATYGISRQVTGTEAFEREGMLVTYVDGEPVGMLMPFKILDNVTMTDPPGLADAMELGAADTAVVLEDHLAPGELDKLDGVTEQEFIDQSPPIGLGLRTIIPPELVGKIERPPKDITGIRGAFLRLGPARTLAHENPVWNRIIHMARDTLEKLAIQLKEYSERVDKVFKGIPKKEVEAFIDLLESKGRPDNIPAHLVSAYDEIDAIRKEFYAMIRDEMGIDVSKWGMTPEEYWPHIFVGEYQILTTKIGKEGKAEWHTIEAGFAKNLQGAIDKAMAFRKENPDADIKIRPKKMVWDYNAVPLTRRGFWRFIHEVEKATELDKDEVMSMMKGVAKIKPRGKFVGNFKQREANLGGYMKDKTALKIYMSRVLRKKWLDPFNKEASDLAMSLPPGLKKYALDYIDNVVGVYDPYDNSYKLKRWVSKGTRLESILKLGYRPVTALLNRLQPMQLGFQEIGHYLWRGWAWKHKAEGKQIIEESGILGDVPYYASGEMGEYVRRIGSWLHPLGLFTKAEMENRKDVICGGYIFARKIYDMDRAKAEKKGFNYVFAYLDQYGGDKRKAALEYAKDLNADVNFTYSNADLPNMFKTLHGRVMFQFKTYPINYLATTLKWTLQKPTNQHYLTRMARMIVTNAILGGVRSVPYIGRDLWKALVFSPLIAALLPERDRDYVRRILGRGVFTIMGFDLSKRLGPNEFIPTQWKDIIGPLGNDVWTLFQFMWGDITWRQFTRIMPMVKDINTALAARGYIVDPNRRMRIITEITGWERFLEGVGAPSEKRQVVQDVQAIISEMDRAYSKNKAKYVDRIYNGWIGLDPEMDATTLNQRMDSIYNDIAYEALEEGVYIEPNDVYKEAVIKDTPQLIRAYEQAPIDMRPEIRRMFERMKKVYGI